MIVENVLFIFVLIVVVDVVDFIIIELGRIGRFKLSIVVI